MRSVVDFSSDRTTVHFTVDGSSNTKTNTMTLGGLTYVEYTATPSVSGRRTATIVVACSRANEVVSDATCLQSELGTESKMSAYCASISTREVQITTDGFGQGPPEWCTDAAAFSEEAKSLETVAATDMATYELVLTAGLEKLSAGQTGSGLGGVASKTAQDSSNPTTTVVATGAAAAVNVPALAAVGAIGAMFL
ncbi:hypothetical protein N0V86_002311 [Didymella sp. IMI 355093]|nr:hypothetical protein N0V86_002311 [Didymella sp. IMI 355093]